MVDLIVALVVLGLLCAGVVGIFQIVIDFFKGPVDAQASRSYAPGEKPDSASRANDYASKRLPRLRAIKHIVDNNISYTPPEEDRFFLLGIEQHIPRLAKTSLMIEVASLYGSIESKMSRGSGPSFPSQSSQAGGPNPGWLDYPPKQYGHDAFAKASNENAQRPIKPVSSEPLPRPAPVDNTTPIVNLSWGSKGGITAGWDVPRRTREKMLMSNPPRVCPCCGDEYGKNYKEYGKIKTLYVDVDHIYPKSLGGNLEKQNLQLICNRCNKAKGNKVFSSLAHMSQVIGKK